MNPLSALLWQQDNLHQGLSKLGIKLGGDKSLAEPLRDIELNTSPNQWFNQHCEQIDMQCERVSMNLSSLLSNTTKLGASVIALAGEEQNHYLVVAKSSRRNLIVIAPDGNQTKLSHRQFIDAVIHSLKIRSQGGIEHILSRFEASIDGLSDALYRKLFISMMSGAKINTIWNISPKERPSILAQLKSQGLWRYLAGFVFGLISVQSFFIASWFVLGSGILAGHAGSDWLSIWLVLLGGFVVARLYTRKKQSELSIMLSAQIKRRMLMGMTDMPLAKAKADGPCHLLTRCYESGQFESASINLVLSSLGTVVTLLLAFITLLTLNLWGLLLASVVIGLLMLAVMWQLYRIELQWTQGRLGLTHSLAELMIGQRTRKVQQLAKLRHIEEDQKLLNYISLQKRRDALQVIYGLIPSGWNVLGIGIVLLGFATNTNMVNLPAGAGIWLMISGAIAQLSSIYLQVIRVLVAWTTIAPVLDSPQIKHIKSEVEFPSDQSNQNNRLLELRDIGYQYPNRQEPVLDGCSLSVMQGDKIIVEGRSGSGKSTLISLLSGVRQPNRGSILLKGVEQNMVSAKKWRQKVVMVPQYHENFLFTETLAYNLLLGTQWPAEPEQLTQARQICIELGLGELLEKMPAELMQVVGEMGWSLSHGEKSRVYIARAILQNPDLLILDESLASLDPINIGRVLKCLEKHCKTVIIVAHP